MIIVKCRVGEDSKLDVIDGDLQSMQDLVGGYIESVPLSERMSLVCNEEGKIEGLKPNRILNVNGMAIDVICGTFFIVGNGAEDFRSLTDDELEEVHHMFDGKHDRIYLEKIL